MQWYLVGGAVRDIFMGLTPSDADLAFSGEIAAVRQAYPQMQSVGRSVEVFLLHGHECMPLHGGSVASDMQARDLTINALALDQDGMVHAHPLALSDMAQRILRPASPRSFFDDPTRIYRLARFAARFPDFSVHPSALEQAAAVVQQGLHRTLPAERVGNELRKALACPRPSRFLRVLHEAGAFNHWFEEVQGAHSIPAGPLPWHEGSVLDHTGEVMDVLAGNALEVWMGLCHDLGKIRTNPQLLPHHYGHEISSAQAALTLGRRLALPSAFIQAGELAAREHMKAGIFETLRMGSRRDLLHKVHSAGLDCPFWHLVDADCGRDMSSIIAPYLAAMLEVSLPEKWRNRGRDSGLQLRLLQCQALSQLHATLAATKDSSAPPLPKQD